MARKAAVEHLRSADNQHYAGSRKLGDQPDTAEHRIAALDDDTPASDGVSTVGQTISDADLAVEAERSALQPGEVLIFTVDNQGRSNGGLTFADNPADPATSAAEHAGRIGAHARWVARNADGSYQYGSTIPEP